MSGVVRTVRHTGISVRDLDVSLSFYRDLLGLTVAVQAEEGGEFLETVLGFDKVRVTTVKLSAPDGPTLVELLRYDEPEGRFDPSRDVQTIGPSHIAFTVDDIDSLYIRLRAAGVRFRSEPRVSADGGAKVAFCSDPDGVPLELVQPL